MEAAVREAGAVPATIGIFEGQIVVGLDGSQLTEMGKNAARKVNAASLGAAIASGGIGATTVSATARAARLAGISIIATGGIGGVHRSSPNDVSADLYELAASPVAVVCSGAKAFLDLAATLDVLESLGVGVIGYCTDEFPAFYSPTSGLRLQDRVDSPAEAAAVVTATNELRGAGLVIANPIPASAALDPTLVDEWSTIALATADSEGIVGPARTPFVLAQLVELSDGRVVEANAALAESNARLAGDVARLL